MEGQKFWSQYMLDLDVTFGLDSRRPKWSNKLKEGVEKALDSIQWDLNPMIYPTDYSKTTGLPDRGGMLAKKRKACLMID